MRDTIEQSRLRLQEFEERQRRVKQEPMENPDMADYRSWQLSSAEVWVSDNLICSPLCLPRHSLSP